MRDVVYTIGYSGYRPREFVEEIRRIGVELVADIRRFPRSSIAGFTALELAESLRDAGIRYKWLGELGALGVRGPRAGCSESATFDRYVWRLYHTADALLALHDLLEAAARAKTAVLCREANWRSCHRQFVADALTAAGFRVVHIYKGRAEPHSPTACFGETRIPPRGLLEKALADFSRLCGAGRSVYLFGGALDGPARDVDVVVYGEWRGDLPEGYDAQILLRPLPTLFHYLVLRTGVLLCGEPLAPDRRIVEAEQADSLARLFRNSDDPVAVCKSFKELLYLAGLLCCGAMGAANWRRLGACLAGLGIAAPGEFKDCLTPPPAGVLRASGEPLLDKVLGLVSQCGTSR
ncbi:MAG: DUF488 family protein [Thermoproteus sp.]|nr:DUF488 family protein [Thermoproteus sp.]